MYLQSPLIGHRCRFVFASNLMEFGDLYQFACRQRTGAGLRWNKATPTEQPLSIGSKRQANPGSSDLNMNQDLEVAAKV